MIRMLGVKAPFMEEGMLLLVLCMLHGGVHGMGVRGRKETQGRATDGKLEEAGMRSYTTG